MVHILGLWLIKKDFSNQSVLHTGVVKVLIDLKICLQLVFLCGLGDLPAYAPYIYTLSLKRSHDGFSLLS